MDLNLLQIVNSLGRWVFVALAVYILARCIMSLIRTKNPAEVWAYMHMVTYKSDDTGSVGPAEEISVPITHWENVIGRARSCDIQAEDSTLSRNHGILMRGSSGEWSYRDLGSKNGTYLEDVKISKEKEMGPPIRLEYGDTLRAGLTEFTLLPISLEEKNNNTAMRKSDTKVMSAGPTLAALTLFQVLTILQLWITLGPDCLSEVIVSIGGLCAVMWIYTGVLKSMGRTGFEMETIAFFLSTLSLAVVASSAPEKMYKQFMAAALGVAIMFVMCLFMRNLERSKALRWPLMAVAALLLIINLIFGTIGFGAKNWLEIGGFSFQPSELVKVAFIWIGAATLDELFQKKNLWIFMGFSAFCFGCLGLMGDFGTAIIFFVTFLIISFLRSGDFSKLILIVGVAAAGGFMILRFKPYVAQRFATWGHAWDPEVMDAAGFQQTRTMSAAASGGLVGSGAAEGWLHSVPAADTDMVFGMLIEEWGLIIAVLAVLSIVTLAVFAVQSIMAGRSTYFTIAACGAMSMFVFQTILNVFGSVDLLPFTGVTFPFVSNGGTSMMVSWALLAFLKAADTREQASLAVKGGAKR
ncbi:MAG: FtsW/RodA/SpoVE family cell cycle protein [Anaerovoracaceae bacterium]|nr:FtsW/RodA/SpoVE family cell cycle protein [Anaerovoracaceae bacterium]